MSNGDEKNSYNFLFKIIMVGDTSVGKTNLLSRYIYGKLPRYEHPTIGVEFTSKPVNLRDGKTVKAQIWDTAGQEKFRAITSAHYRKSVGALIVFDLTKRTTF
jgi:small GTP-binding protein